MRNRIGIAAFTGRGNLLADCIERSLSETHDTFRYSSGLKDWCRAAFEERVEGIVFVGACGIAVRSIAPFMKSKTTDPAVLVIDEAGQFVISLLSGHIGGANELALRVAAEIGAVPVITTATDVNGRFAVDVFAKENRLRIDSMKAAKEVSAAILRGESIGVFCTGKMEGTLPEGLTAWNFRESRWTDQDEKDPGDKICKRGPLIFIGREAEAENCESWNLAKESWFSDPEDLGQQILKLWVRPYVLGIGCRKGKPYEEIRPEILGLLGEEKIDPAELYAAASIDLKKEEEGILQLCREWNLPFDTYSAEVLDQVPGEFTPSEFVRKTTGVDNVCERSALCRAGEQAVLIRKKYAKNGVTAAIAVRDWSVHFEK